MLKTLFVSAPSLSCKFAHFWKPPGDWLNAQELEKETKRRGGECIRSNSVRAFRVQHLCALVERCESGVW